VIAVLFDLDGVIVDSREHHVSAWEAWAREHAPYVPKGYFHRCFGLRNDAIIGGLIAGLTTDELNALAEHKEALFRARAGGNLQALAGVIELLEFLETRGIPTAIVTSTPRENLDLVLETIGLVGRFGTLVAEEDASRGKPDPEGFLVAAERLGVAASDCVVIEDAPAGLQAAKAGGMRAIGVTTTHPASALGDADIVVASLAEAAVREFIARGSEQRAGARPAD
jgi:HAD superfamily hydrolase (TIGR01509 family)